MESESKTEVKEGLENLDVDRDSKAERNYNQSTNGIDPGTVTAGEVVDHQTKNEPSCATSVPSEATTAKNVDPSTNTSNDTGHNLSAFGSQQDIEIYCEKRAECDESHSRISDYESHDPSNNIWKISESSGNLPNIEEDPQKFMTGLSLKLGEWKKVGLACPAEMSRDEAAKIKELCLETVTANLTGRSSSKEVKSATLECHKNAITPSGEKEKPECETELKPSISLGNPSLSWAGEDPEEIGNTSGWRSMDKIEKMRFICFRQKGIPRDEALARIREKPSQQVKSEPSTSFETLDQGSNQVKSEPSTAAETLDQCSQQVKSEPSTSFETLDQGSNQIKSEPYTSAETSDLHSQHVKTEPSTETMAQPSQQVKSEPPTSAETLEDRQITSRSDPMYGKFIEDLQKPKKLKLNLKGGELPTFKKLRLSGMSRKEAWDRMRELRVQWQVLIAEPSSRTVESKTSKSAENLNHPSTDSTSADSTNKCSKKQKNIGEEREKLKKQQALNRKRKTERVKMFNKFDHNQKLLHLKLRQEGVSHPDAVDKVLEVSAKIGTKNIKFAILEKLFGVGGPGTSLSAVLERLICGEVPGTSLLSDANQVGICSKTDAHASAASGVPTPTTENSGNISVPGKMPDVPVEVAKHHQVYGDFILGLQRHPKCEHSLGEILQMAERIPEGHGIYGRKIFILRCFEFGVDPVIWDWSRYSKLPSAPKILPKSLPPRKSIQKREALQRECNLPSCTHASCKYFSSTLKQQHPDHEITYNNSKTNLMFRNTQFKSPRNDPPDPAGEQWRHQWVVPGPTSSCQKREDIHHEPGMPKRSKFVEPVTDPLKPPGTLPKSGQAPSSPGNTLHLYIVPSRYPSELLDDEQMYEIENSILEAILRIHDERMRPIFDGSFHNNGRYEVICHDPFAKEWLHKYVSCMKQQWPNASLRIIPAEPIEIGANSVQSVCNDYDDRGTQDSRELYEPRCGTSGGSGSQKQGGYSECSEYIASYEHFHPTRRNLQERLGPKIESPECSRSQYIEPSQNVLPRQEVDEPGVVRSYSPDHRVYGGEPSEYVDTSWDPHPSSSMQNTPERFSLEVEITQNPISDDTHSRYIKPSLRGTTRQEVDRSSPSRGSSPDYIDYGEHSRCVRPSLSNRDLLVRFDPSDGRLTRIRSPQYISTRYVEPSRHSTLRQEMDDRLSRRSNSPVYTAYREPSGYTEPSWRGETLSNDCYPERGLLERSTTSHSRCPSPIDSRSRDLSRYCEPGRDRWYRSPSPGEPSRSDARERLRQIRNNRIPTSSNYIERHRSPAGSLYSSHSRNRNRSPPLSSSSCYQNFPSRR